MEEESSFITCAARLRTKIQQILPTVILLDGTFTDQSQLGTFTFEQGETLDADLTQLLKFLARTQQPVLYFDAMDLPAMQGVYLTVLYDRVKYELFYDFSLAFPDQFPIIHF